MLIRKHKGALGRLALVFAASSTISACGCDGIAPLPVAMLPAPPPEAAPGTLVADVFFGGPSQATPPVTLRCETLTADALNCTSESILFSDERLRPDTLVRLSWGVDGGATESAEFTVAERRTVGRECPEPIEFQFERVPQS